MDAKESLRDIFGINKASTKVQTISDVLGAAILGGGLYGAFNAPKYTYSGVTKQQQSDIAGIRAKAGTREEEADKALTADLAGYTEGAIKGAQTGLEARGINDSSVAKETATSVKAGLSGAYAAARATLAKAKSNAGASLSNALTGYYMDLAQKQYSSQLANYQAKSGLYGALGGIGASLLSAKEQVDKEDTQVDPNGTSEGNMEKQNADKAFRNKQAPVVIPSQRTFGSSPFADYKKVVR